MAGKASLLVAALLFGVGATGLALTAGDSAHWGPFQAGVANQQPVPYESQVALFAQSVIVLPGDGGFSVPVAVEPTHTPAPKAAVLAEAPVAPVPSLVPTAATPPPPLLVHGIAADDGNVGAAGTAPPSVRILMVSGDGADDVAATPEAPAATPTDTPEPATAPAEATPTPGSD